MNSGRKPFFVFSREFDAISSGLCVYTGHFFLFQKRYTSIILQFYRLVHTTYRYIIYSYYLIFDRIRLIYFVLLHANGVIKYIILYRYIVQQIVSCCYAVSKKQKKKSNLIIIILQIALNSKRDYVLHYYYYNYYTYLY